MYLSQLEYILLSKMSEKIINDVDDSEIITEKEIKEILNLINDAQNKYELISALDTLNYSFSVLLSEIRVKKRNVLTGIFEIKPKLAEEKSVLEKKLDAEPEYAKYKEKEEYLFQIIEHINNLKNNITWLIREENE